MIAFFLDNWSDVRGSEAMRHVWQQIRVGGHPGFEEGVHVISLTQYLILIIVAVWPLIALNLEFKPHSMEEAPVEAPPST
jgi:hypothetical protein